MRTRTISRSREANWFARSPTESVAARPVSVLCSIENHDLSGIAPRVNEAAETLPQFYGCLQVFERIELPLTDGSALTSRAGGLIIRRTWPAGRTSCHVCGATPRQKH